MVVPLLFFAEVETSDELGLSFQDFAELKD